MKLGQTERLMLLGLDPGLPFGPTPVRHWGGYGGYDKWGQASRFTPESLGTIRSWTKGDDAEFAHTNPGIYDHLDDTGTLGGQWDAVTAAPLAVLHGGKEAPIFRGTRAAQSSLAASTWAFYHDGTEDFHDFFSYTPTVVTTSANIFTTFGGLPGQVGMTVSVNASGQVQFIVANGSGSYAGALTSTVTLVAGTRHDIEIRKTGTTIYLSVDNETPLSTTLTTPSASAPQHTAVLGNNNNANKPCDGVIHEHISYSGVNFGPTPRAQVRAYMASRWSDTPDFAPSSLGEVVSWVVGDYASYETDKPGVYDHLDEIGTLGGQWDAATNAHPTAVAVGGRNTPVFRGTRRAQSSLAASNFTFLHDGTSDASVNLRVYIYGTPAANERYWGTCNAVSTDTGIVVYGNSGQVRLAVCNGSGGFGLLLNSTGSLAQGWNTIQITKSGADYGIAINGDALNTGTATSPSASAPSIAPVLGNYSTGSVPLNGLAAECTIHNVELDSSGLSSMRTYMTDRWSAAPSYALFAYGDVAHDHNMSVGVTEASGDASDVADQSGYNNDYNQGTTGKRPTIHAARRNGQDSVEFDGTDDLLGPVTLTQGAIIQKFTVYTVFEYVDDGGSQYIHSSGNNGDVLIIGASDKLQAYGGSGLDSPSGLSAGIAISRAVFDTTGQNAVVQDGVFNQAASGSVGSNSPTVVALGGFSGDSTHMTGHVYRDFTVVGDDSDNAAILAQLQQLYDVTPASGDAALSFDGTDDVVDFGQPSELDDLDYDQTFSISMWIRSTDTGTNYLWSRNSDPADGAFGFQMREDGIFQIYFEDTTNGNDYRVETSSQWNDGNWHHVVFSKTAVSVASSSFEIWVDGASQALTEDTGDAINNAVYGAQATLLGARKDGSGYATHFDGDMRGVAAYADSLGSSDIALLYNSGTYVNPDEVETAENAVFVARLNNPIEVVTVTEEVNDNNGTTAGNPIYAVA